MAFRRLQRANPGPSRRYCNAGLPVAQSATLPARCRTFGGCFYALTIAPSLEYSLDSRVTRHDWSPKRKVFGGSYGILEISNAPCGLRSSLDAGFAACTVGTGERRDRRRRARHSAAALLGTNVWLWQGHPEPARKLPARHTRCQESGGFPICSLPRHSER